MVELKDEAFELWIAAQKHGYGLKCRLAFIKFERFLKEKYGLEMNGESILAKHKENRKSEDAQVKYFFDDSIPVFINWIEAKGSTHNSAFVQSGMVRGFFKKYRLRLEIQDKNAKQFNEVKKRYHIYTRDELVKMVEVGDLEARALILLGAELGIRVNDFVTLKRQFIMEAYQNSNGEFPLEFEIATEKENVIAIGHISKEVYEALQYYWASLKLESEWAFPYNGSHIIDQRANDILKDCWLRAFPDRKGQRIRFHELRSYKMTALANTGANQWAIMRMVGKKLKSDIKTYVEGINYKDIFTKAEHVLNLTQIVNGNNHNAIEELKNENKELKARLYEVEQDVKAIAEVMELKREDLPEYVEFIRALKQKESPNT